jgi:hypothetical protein
METMLDQIRIKEQTRFSAMIARDLDALSELLDDDLIYVHSNGKADTKSEYLESLRQGSIVYEAVQVLSDRHWQGKESFVLLQSLAARMRLGVGAEPLERKLTIMSVWRLTTSGWKLVAMQSTAAASNQ